MKKTIRIIILSAVLSGNTSLQAQEIRTFSFEGVGGSVTVTQDIPAYFFGKYDSLFPELQPGKMLFLAGRNPVSHHWWNKVSREKNFTWGVLVKNGKIDKQRITPPNPDYKPYYRLKLIIRYEDENPELVAWGLYRAESKKYGTHILAGRYIKKTRK
ncbi:MAG: hypothetical protein V3R65_00455 [Acidiferrobacterales bacterium]